MTKGQLFEVAILFALLALPVIASVIGYRRRVAFEDQFAHSYVSAAPRAKVSSLLSTCKTILFALATVAISVCILADVDSDRLHSSVPGRNSMCLCIDVSRSMLAPDGQESRMERARKSAEIILGNASFDNFAIVQFAANASVAVPPTSDTKTIGTALGRLDPFRFVPQGSAVGTAVELAALTRVDSSAVNAIVVISDGEFHDEPEWGRISSLGVPVHCIMVGSESQTIPDSNGKPLTDAAGVVIHSTPNADCMESIAAKTGGEFVRAESYDAVARFAKKSLLIQPNQVPDGNIDFRIVIAFALLGAYILLPQARRVRIPKATATISLLLVWVVSTTSATDRATFDEATKNYRDANYSTAAKGFARLAEKESDSTRLAICLYNQANAVYKSAIGNSNDSTRNQLLESIALFQSALRIRPNDSSAQYNLAMAQFQLARLRKDKSKQDKIPAKKEQKEEKESPSKLNQNEMKQLMQLARRNSTRMAVPAGLGANAQAASTNKPW